MNSVCIVDSNRFINSFYCKKCKRGTKEIYKVDGKSYCDNCIDDSIKIKCKRISQNRENFKNNI